MFYNHELLTEPSSRLAIVWLAATLGNRSSFKKLTKAQISNVDLVKVCKMVANPPEDMALRLRSQLLLGAVRIYDAQAESLQRATEATQNALKRSVLHSFTSAAHFPELTGLKALDGKDLQMNKRAAAATVKPDEYRHYGQFPFDYAQEYLRVVGKGPASTNREPGFDSSFSGSSSQYRLHEQATAAERRSPSVDRQSVGTGRSGSQPATRKPWQLASAFALGGSFGAPDVGSSDLDDHSTRAFGFPPGADIDIDLGLLDGLGLDDQGADAFGSVAGVDRSEPYSRRRGLGQDVETLQLEHNILATDKGRVGLLSQRVSAPTILGRQPNRSPAASRSGTELSVGLGRRATGTHGSSVDLQAMLGVEADDALFLDSGYGEGQQDWQLPPISWDNGEVVQMYHGEHDRLLQGGEQPPIKRARTYYRRTETFDKHLQLTQDEMRVSRLEYKKRQSKVVAAREQSQKRKAFDQWATGMMGAGMFGHEGPLAELANELLVDEDDESTPFKADALADYQARGETIYVEDAEDELAAALASVIAGSMSQSGFGPAQAQFGGDDFLAAMLGNDGAMEALMGGLEPQGHSVLPRSVQSLPHALPSQAGVRLMFDARGQQVGDAVQGPVVSDHTSAIQSGAQDVHLTFEDGVGLGDGGELAGLDSSSLVGGAFAVHAGEQEPVPARDSMQGRLVSNTAREAPRRRQGSLDFDGDASGIGVPRHAASELSSLPALVPWSQPLDGHDEEATGMPTPDLPAVIPRDSTGHHSMSPASNPGPQSRAPAFGETQGTQTTSFAGESQVERDLGNYLNYTCKLAEKKKEESEEPLHLTDVVPPGAVTRSTACKAFYNTLALASSGKLKVQQDEAYGPIHLEPVAEP